MTLNDFLTKSDMPRATFAKRIGVSAAAVTYWVKGDRVPTLKLAIKIRDNTCGLVDIDSWENKG